MGMRKIYLRRMLAVTLAAGVFTGLPADMPAMYWGTNVAQAASIEWKQGENLDSWGYGGTYSYTGTPEIASDAAYGGSIRLGVDFTAHAADGWSEVKLENKAAGQGTLELDGQNTLSFNMYFQPAAMSQGCFKLKLYAKSADGEEVINVCPDVDLSAAKDAGGGMKYVPVEINFGAVSGRLSYLCLSIVGSNTDYRGDIYVSRLCMSDRQLPDGYVDVNTSAIYKQPLKLSELQLPGSVALADGNATAKTARLFAYLQAVANSDKVMYGHQNELHKKVAGSLAGSSDTEDMVGDQAAVMGFDALALTGDELELTEAEKAAGISLSQKLADMYIKAAGQGAILTMSCHMPNFDLVEKKPKVDGHYDFQGYSPNRLDGDVVARILPGGDLNHVYTDYLDMVAEFDSRLQSADVPLIYRPFHENNGSWFWWGASSCSPSQYKNLFRYTVEYLRDVKGLHNLLYAYSPGGPLVDEADYLSRYPGDEFVDVAGFDMYHRNPAAEDAWMEGFGKTMKVVGEFAQKHHKAAAVTEVGMLYGNSALVVTGNTRPDWFNEALVKIAPENMAYFMTWSNFDEGNFDQPYMVSDSRGHELVNGFISFYNRPQSIFMKESSDYSKIDVTSSAARADYGYITSPESYTRVLEDLALTAKLGGHVSEAAFVLRGTDGSELARAQAKIDGDTARAVISSEQVKAMGRQIATAELVVNGVATDRLPLLLNMPAPKHNPYLVDDFDSYYGDNGLLSGMYTTNTGSGCSAAPQLAKEKQAGESGLAFCLPSLRCHSHPLQFALQSLAAF